MSVLVVGISHNSAPVQLLEQLAIDRDGLLKLVQDVAHTEHVAEATVIATCNRLEVYSEVDRFHGSVEQLSRLLVERAGLSVEDVLPHLYVHYDDGAVSHLFKVAARPAPRSSSVRSWAPSAPPSTRCSSRRCGWASAATPRPTSTRPRRPW
jgi:glutamyl-tRNA reductase